jgi:hypothetical protein
MKAPSAPPCTSCNSSNLVRMDSEICLHFPGMDGLDKEPIFVFPTTAVCLDCGIMQCQLKPAERTLIQNPRQLPR